MTLAPSPPTTRGLTERDFTALYSAAAFAAAFDLICDTSITIARRLLGPEIEANVPPRFTTFLKCLRDWLTSRHIPLAWLYCHDDSLRIGLHTHVIHYVPGAIGADRPRRIVLVNPDIEIGLQLVDETIRLSAERDTVKLIERGLVEALADTVGLRALGFGARVIDVLDREVEFVLVPLWIAAALAPAAG